MMYRVYRRDIRKVLLEVEAEDGDAAIGLWASALMIAGVLEMDDRSIVPLDDGTYRVSEPRRAPYIVEAIPVDVGRV